MEEESLLTTEEVMAFFTVSKRTLLNWVAAGKIPRPIMIGGLNRWKHSDLQNFVANLMPKVGKRNSGKGKN